jgi:hypothetical protein
MGPRSRWEKEREEGAADFEAGQVGPKGFES